MSIRAPEPILSDVAFGASAGRAPVTSYELDRTDPLPPGYYRSLGQLEELVHLSQVYPKIPDARESPDFS